MENSQGPSETPAGQLDYSLVAGVENSDVRPNAERQAEHKAEQDAAEQKAKAEQEAKQQTADAGQQTGGLPAGEFDNMDEDALDAALHDELTILQDLNPDGHYYDYGAVTVQLLESVKTLRLIGQGDIEQAGQLLIRSAEAAARLPGMDFAASMERVALLRSYVATVFPGDDAGIDYLSDLVRSILKIRNGDMDEA